MPESSLGSILEGEDPLPLLALSEDELEDRGVLGPEAYYYLGRWLIDRVEDGTEGVAARIRLLFRLGFERGTGLPRLESARALVRALASEKRWDELEAFALDARSALGEDWTIERGLLEALDGLGRYGESLDAAEALRASFPAESADDGAALDYFVAAASFRLGRPGAAELIRDILLKGPSSARIAKTLDLVAPPAAPADPASGGAALPAEVLAAARMRVLIRSRDYGPAYREASKAALLFTVPGASSELLGDLGKAYLYSGSSKEGASLFARLESEARARAGAGMSGEGQAAALEEKLAWTALFYRGRFARAREDWETARALFAAAAGEAGTETDADSALWYSVECAINGAKARAAAAEPGPSAPRAATRAEAMARRASLDALVAASAGWKNPAAFADLTDSLFREAIGARDWYLIDAMRERLSPAATPDIAARMAYARDRAFELGLFPSADARFTGGRDPDAPRPLAPPGRAAEAKARFSAMAADPAAPLHYRVLAAWRSDESPELVAPPAKPRSPPSDPDPTESLIAGFPRFNLAHLGVEEARARSSALDDEALRRLAESYAKAKRVDSSIRLMNLLASRPGWIPRRSDYELLYPRPYLSEYRALRPRADIPEHIFYGLLRSESLFRSDVKSRAGAVGIAQLMPATAAETAKDLGMESYDLTSVSDNLRIGAAIFAELLAETKRPLRAMWAYNAGRGRLRKWLGESSDLPDDLMIEALGLVETRQYSRNIVAASAMYGELYYGLRAARVAKEMATEGSFR